MTKLALKYLDEMVEEKLPPELLLNEHHPRNDEYQTDLVDIKNRITAQVAKMPPRNAQAVRLHTSGTHTRDIAKQLNVDPATIRNYTNSEDGKRLASLIYHLQQAIDGATVDHRKAFLWRIALDNEQNRPNISVTAIDTINKMSGTYQPQDNHTGGINITINNELLPQGTLDKLPKTYESRLHESMPTITTPTPTDG